MGCGQSSPSADKPDATPTPKYTSTTEANDGSAQKATPEVRIESSPAPKPVVKQQSELVAARSLGTTPKKKIGFQIKCHCRVR